MRRIERIHEHLQLQLPLHCFFGVRDETLDLADPEERSPLIVHPPNPP